MTEPIQMHLDSPAPGNALSVGRPCLVRGWAFSASAPIDRVEACLGNRLLGPVVKGVKRPDVAAAFPNKAPEGSGFEQFLVLDDFDPGDYDLVITAHDKAGNFESVSQPVMLVPPPERSRPINFPNRAARQLDRSLRKLRSRLGNGLPTVEIRIPISATEQFLRMLHYFLESLQVFSGSLARSAHCVVSVSRDQPVRDLSAECAWAKDYSVEFQWLDQDLFDRLEYHGTGMHRFEIPSKADVVMLMDVDLLIAGDFDSAIRKAWHSQSILGFLAHVSPFSRHHALRDIPSERWWQWIFEEAGLPPPALTGRPTAWGALCRDERHRSCPENYFNCGVMIGPRILVERLGTTYEAECESVDRVLETDFKSQIANVLACARHEIPCGTLPMNDNFALNIPEEDLRRLNPDPEGKDRPEDIRIFHYLASGEINKRHFATRDDVETLLRREDLSPAGKVMQEKLQIVHTRITSRTES